MKAYVLSDLHIEFCGFSPEPNGYDLVILAGDIHTKTRGVEWANDTFSCDVLYVMGNHEFYSGHFDRMLEKARLAAAPHVHLLENDTFVWNQIRFLGTTCWTDFTSSGDMVAATSIARETMTDFKVIRAGPNYRRLRPDDVICRNRRAKEWLTQELSRPFLGRTVVITHHSPLVEVGGGHEGHLTAAYCNSWHRLVEQSDYWIFGHTHESVDVQLGGCRVVSNQRGYPGESTGFAPGKIVEII